MKIVLGQETKMIEADLLKKIEDKIDNECIIFDKDSDIPDDADNIYVHLDYLTDCFVDALYSDRIIDCIVKLLKEQLDDDYVYTIYDKTIMSMQCYYRDHVEYIRLMIKFIVDKKLK